MKNLMVLMLMMFFVASCAQEESETATDTENTEEGAGKKAGNETNTDEDDELDDLMSKEKFEDEDDDLANVRTRNLNTFQQVAGGDIVGSLPRWDPLWGQEWAVEASIQACLDYISTNRMNDYEEGRAACLIYDHTNDIHNLGGVMFKRRVHNAVIIDSGEGIGRAAVRIYFYRQGNMVTLAKKPYGPERTL